MKVGDMVRWVDHRKGVASKHLGLIIAAQGTREYVKRNNHAYYNVLVDGKIEFCHRNNLEVLSESR